MTVKEALIQFVYTVLDHETPKEQSRVCLELKDFNPLTEAGLALTFGKNYAPKNKVVLWSSNKELFPQVLTVEAGVEEFLRHYGLE